MNCACTPSWTANRPVSMRPSPLTCAHRHSTTNRSYVARHQTTLPKRCRHLKTLASSNGNADDFKEQARLLNKLFYSSQNTIPGSSSISKEGIPLQIPSLPLWRVQWALLPGMQELLHVHAPHYVHMFEGIFAKPRPWYFGHVYLPHGSESLGSPEFSLKPGTKAPLVGVLMEISRALRLPKGRLLIVATAVTRIKVTDTLQEIPYSCADVEVHPDYEEVSSVSRGCSSAMPDLEEGTDIQLAMQACDAVGKVAAVAASSCWLQEYELVTARQNQWDDDEPREAKNSLELGILVQDMVSCSREVVPLPDGNIVGRWDLEALVQRAEDSLEQASKEFDMKAFLLNAQHKAPQPFGSSMYGRGGTPDIGIDYSTVAEDDSDDLMGAVLKLEEAVWRELDAVAALALKVHKSRLTIPLGLLQLRPPPSTQTSSPTSPPALSSVATSPVHSPPQTETNDATQCSSHSTSTPTTTEPIALTSLPAASTADARPPTTIEGGDSTSPPSERAAAGLPPASGLQPTTSSSPPPENAAAGTLSTTIEPSASTSPPPMNAAAGMPSSTKEPSASALPPPENAAAGVPPSTTAPTAPASPPPDPSAAGWPPATSGSLEGEGVVDTSQMEATTSASASPPVSGAASNASASAAASGVDDGDGGNGVAPIRDEESLARASEVATGDNSAAVAAVDKDVMSGKYHMMASEGLELHADPSYPAYRRAQRLSYAVVATLLKDLGAERWQQLLEAPCIAQRLRLVINWLRRQRNLYAALAAVQDLNEKKSS